MTVKFYLLIVLFIMGFGSNVRAQTVSECAPSIFLKKAYLDDVKLMATERMYEIKSADTILIDIPALHTDSIFSALAAINNLVLADKSIDSIFNVYCIHNNIHNSVEMILNKSYAWTEKWKDTILVTGYGALDSLVARYGGRLHEYYEISSYAVAHLSFDSFVNIRAMADSLKYFDGIGSAYRGHLIGDGHFITYQRDSVPHFKFSLGWGDCPSGCTHRRTWFYRVDNSCAVTLESYTLSNSPGGDPQPALVNCNYFPNAIKTYSVAEPLILVYPNPAQQSIHVKGLLNATYYIMDLSGRRLQHGQLDHNNTISINMLVPGMYWLKMNSDQDNAVRQFVKQ